jgi:tellurite resistance protein
MLLPWSPIMPDVSDNSLVETIRLYRETLAAIRDLYVSSGSLIRDSYGWLADGATADVAALTNPMDDLHQGLVMKIYATAVPSLRADAMQQRQLGRATLEHIWGTTVMGSQLRQAVDWLIQESGNFRWQDLVKPFAEIPPLRDRWGELEALVIRAATLIATADGDHSTSDNQLLSDMRQQLERLADRAPEKFVADAKPSRDAIVWLREEAERLRKGAGTPASNAGQAEDVHPKHPPTPKLPPKSETASKTPASSAGHLQTPPDDRTPAERLADAKKKLDELIGLSTIKDSIETLTNFLKLESLRAAESLPTTRPSLHMSFVGNPGTGKTSVARIVAEIYGALGVLEKGHLVETDRSGLVAEYAGQTGPKTNAKVDEALDGVLFIDEAYSLIDESGQDQYGREAIQTLLKRMEDQRDRLVVILAGYTDEMFHMIRSNPGLSSRVGTTLEFDDYSPEELCRIFGLIAAKAKYELPPGSRLRLIRGFTFLYATRDRHFGNGRTARNSFERSIKRLANRLSKVTEVSRELLTTLQPEDIEIDGVTPAYLDELVKGTGRVRVICPKTQKPMIIDDSMLGTEVQSEHCDETFVAQWGCPVLANDQAMTNDSDAQHPAD